LLLLLLVRWTWLFLAWPMPQDVVGSSFLHLPQNCDHVMEKLDIHDTAGLVRYAIRRGPIEP
jgi:hypothetical protein